ncbi:hypothetical protein Cst_c21010 [Thermoclostridium stercorarium subsp. stercorarium DSM 8532]|uniref:Uncharacterized protein n=1 Tax=Thermoclostridium stercorarium (strain ATCC 35414 / DSM 8532 / NCIMB 11754) TaxID=1121335 RepID=L7VU13_THES1|nr:hypothetical protein Cst_c21010 [Thermoclostridium stercorarium subsp. stercorarium DSM 8532]
MYFYNILLTKTQNYNPGTIACHIPHLLLFYVFMATFTG